MRNPLHRRLPALWVGSLLFFHTFAVAVPLYDAEVDHSLYDDLLRSYVTVDGLVNYEGLRTNSLPDLQKYLDLLAQTKIKNWSYEEKLAFWINAYNAHVLQLVLTHPEMKKINAHPEFFDIVLPIARGQYSLNDIEHRIIRGKENPTTREGPIKGVTLDLFDPRVHFTLVCGAIGAPPLRNTAYTAKTMEDTLRRVSSGFANSKKYLRYQDGKLHISNLMNTYTEDFDTWGGPASYLSHLLDSSRRDDVDEIKKHLITEYRKAEFEYDWTINDILNAPTVPNL